MNDEDIKILEELLNKKYEDKLLNTLETISEEDEVYILTIFERQAIKNLLNRNKELEEIEQEHRKENGKLRKKVSELEEERQIVGMPVKNKRDGRIGVVLHQWENGSIAVLESINPRVINTHDSWNTLEIVTDEVKQTKTKYESIPVLKIKEIVDECIPRGKNIITGVEEYQPNANANSYLAQEVLKLLEGK